LKILEKVLTVIATIIAVPVAIILSYGSWLLFGILIPAFIILSVVKCVFY